MLRIRLDSKLCNCVDSQACKSHEIILSDKWLISLCAIMEVLVPHDPVLKLAGYKHQCHRDPCSSPFAPEPGTRRQAPSESVVRKIGISHNSGARKLNFHCFLTTNIGQTSHSEGLESQIVICIKSDVQNSPEVSKSASKSCYECLVDQSMPSYHSKTLYILACPPPLHKIYFLVLYRGSN